MIYTKEVELVTILEIIFGRAATWDPSWKMGRSMTWVAVGRLRRELHAGINAAKVQTSGSCKLWNLVAVEDVRVVVRDEFGGVGSSLFGGCLVLCKDFFLGL